MPHRDASDTKLPPEDLIYRVSGTRDSDWFHRSGALSLQGFEEALASIGRSLQSFESILDFGCGCGRVMSWMAGRLDNRRLHGVDIDREAIEWAKQNLGDIDFRVIETRPPTSYANNEFDLVYCHSVFTHLNEAYQDEWLAELRRITKPGGILLVTTHGEHAFDGVLKMWREHNADPSPLERKLRNSGTLFIVDDSWKNGPFPDYYHSMFHLPWYVKRHWGDFFAVRAHFPKAALDFQDLWVLERPAPCAAGGVSEDAPDDNAAAVCHPPLPEPDFRRLVGPLDDEFYDNPTGSLVYPEIPAHLYESVFDFGCGCGRIARQLLQQRVRPTRYLGIDIHKGMIAWCRDNLAAIDSHFEFLHHDVYNIGLAPENTKRYTAPFPAEDGQFSLVLAHSVFTHLLKEQTEFYLQEVARVLAEDGIARTTWFFFDRESFPYLAPHQVCLYVNPDDPTNAVVYDRRWFLDALSNCGLSVRLTIPPERPGHQWQVFLDHRRPGQPDEFPTGEEASEWLCGTTRRAIPRRFWRG